MKKSITYYPAALIGKAMYRLMRLMHKNATNLPGEVALILCPKLLSCFKMPKTVIVVTGTNGKTTVTNLIGNALKKRGIDIITNSLGGNVDTGVASVLLANSKLNGTLKKDTVLLEMDERSASRILPYIQPDYLVCTNLLRDSMKRNAHTGYIFNRISPYIPKKTHLILNADDLISSQLAPENSRTYFSVNQLEGEIPTTDNIICDILYCPKCETKLEYKMKHYNHLGKAVCPKCGYTNAQPQFKAFEAKCGTLSLEHDGCTEKYPLPNDRIIDVYNTTTAVSFLRTYGWNEDEVNDGLKDAEIVKTRYDKTLLRGKNFYNMLAKGQSSIACSATFDSVRKIKGTKGVILILDDFYDGLHSSENIAWLYDTDFEFLNGDDFTQFVVGGARAEDVKIRLMLAGVSEEKIICCRHEMDTYKLLQWDKFDNLVLLYEVYNIGYAEQIMKELREEEK